MTIAVNLKTVATSIAGFSISGVTIKNVDNIPTSGAMICPVMFPNPNFVTGVKVDVLTVGGYPTAMIDMEYTLNYIYLHCEAGGLSQLEVISPLLDKFADIVEAFAGNAILGLVDVTFDSNQAPGIIRDPAGNEFWGMMFTVKVKDKIQ